MAHSHNAVIADEVDTRPHMQYQGALFSIVLPGIFALIYAGFLASLPVNAFIDRDNYIIYTYISDVVLSRNYDSGWSSVLFNEPLWLLLNIGLSRILDPDDTIRAIIFFPALLASFVILRNNRQNLIYAVIFLFLPLFLKNYIIHLRQGVAISVFIFAYYSNIKNAKPIMLALTPFIHSSFFFVLMIYAISRYLSRTNVPTFISISAFSLLFIMIGLTINLISSGLGARQGTEYIGATIDVSGLAFAFWAVILLIFLSSGEAFLKKNLFEVSSIAFYLCTYFTTAVSGRIFESSVIVIVLSGLALSGARKHLFLLTILAFMMSDYAMRYGQPSFGWGAI